MYMHSLKPGVVFNFETDGPINPATKWSFDEFYSPADRAGSFLDIFRKTACLRMVNKVVSNGGINRAGKWEATVIRKRLQLYIRVRYVGPATGSTKL